MFPSYLRLSKREINEKIKKLHEILKNCEICPRKCHIDRTKGEKGYCQTGIFPRISGYHPHFGEEKPLVGDCGSGTIFFTSCNLSCVYCQNYEISQLRIGEEISFEELADIMIKLQDLGCHNINFVTPTHQIFQILKSLSIAIEKGLKIPLVYNTNAYDSVQVLKIIKGVFDIYLPDLKYSDNDIALKYSNASNYVETMKSAVKEMYSQVGDLLLDKKGVALKGLLVRHLILPNQLAGSEKIFQFITSEISKNTAVNIMDQYWPAYKARYYPEIAERVNESEIEKVYGLAKEFGLKIIS